MDKSKINQIKVNIQISDLIIMFPNVFDLKKCCGCSPDFPVLCSPKRKCFADLNSPCFPDSKSTKRLKELRDGWMYIIPREFGSSP